MRYIVTPIFLSSFLMFPKVALACSCAWDSSISDLENYGATVLLASPVGGNIQTLYGNDEKTFIVNVPTRFKVWKTYLGQAAEFEDIDMSQSSSCATSYPVHEVSVIVAYRRNGRLSTGFCASKQFSRQQLIDYFEYGKDTFGRDYCYTKIFNAYKNEDLTGEFRLENEQCLIHKQEYDAKYKVKIKGK